LTGLDAAFLKLNCFPIALMQESEKRRMKDAKKDD
jgi:hypothetical protein